MDLKALDIHAEIDRPLTAILLMCWDQDRFGSTVTPRSRKSSEGYSVILLTKTTATQNEDALSYFRVRGLYYLAVVFVATIYHLRSCMMCILQQNVERAVYHLACIDEQVSNLSPCSCILFAVDHFMKLLRSSWSLVQSS